MLDNELPAETVALSHGHHLDAGLQGCFRRICDLAGEVEIRRTDLSNATKAFLDARRALIEALDLWAEQRCPHNTT